MAVANKILSKMDEDLPLVEPVVRHGLEPEFHAQQAFDAAQIGTLFTNIQARHQSVALICKTTEDATHFERALATAGVHAQLLDEQAAIDQQALLVVPSHLSKGLEFDAVMIVCDNDGFRDTPLERKLLYVATTRAMHELHLIGQSMADFLL